MVLFGKSKGSAIALLGGNLKLRYCKRPFARLFPSWKLPGNGQVSQLVADWAALGVLAPNVLSGGAGGFWSGGPGGFEPGGAGGPLVHLPGGAGGSGWLGVVGRPEGSLECVVDGGTKRIRLTRKTTPARFFFSPFVAQPIPKRWKRLRTGGEEASLMELALPPEEDGMTGPVTGFDRIGIG